MSRACLNAGERSLAELSSPAVGSRAEDCAVMLTARLGYPLKLPIKPAEGRGPG